MFFEKQLKTREYIQNFGLCVPIALDIQHCPKHVEKKYSNDIITQKLKDDYIMRRILYFLWNTFIISLFVYFFNANADMVFKPRFNWINLWLIFAWICQFFLFNFHPIKKIRNKIKHDKSTVLPDNPMSARLQTITEVQNDAVNLSGWFMISIIKVFISPILLILKIVLTF